MGGEAQPGAAAGLGRTRWGTGPTDWQAACQPKSFLRPCVLLLLDEDPAYGYELRTRLAPFRCGTWDNGTIYRLLNAMELEGLVASLWERSSAGPRRRRYHLTDQGREELAEWARSVAGICSLLTTFGERFGAITAKHLELDGHRTRGAVPIP